MPDLTADSQAEEQAAEQPESVESQEALEKEAPGADEGTLPSEEAQPKSVESQEAEASTADEGALPPEEAQPESVESQEAVEAEASTADETSSAPAEEAADEEVSSSEEAAVDEEVGPEETLPEGPSFGERLATAFSALRAKIGTAVRPLGERLSVTFAPLRERLGIDTQAYGIYILIAALVLVALFLPPVSLLQRLGITGYTTINAGNASIEYENLKLWVNPETFTGKVRVRLDSVPQLNLLEGSAGKALRAAVEALPGHLVVKSELYQIHTRGQPEQPVILDVALPANAEPWETLDLYTWTGEAWDWVGSELHTETAEQEFIRAQVIDVPSNLVVMQTEASTSTIAAYVEQGETPNPHPIALDEINPAGLMLSTDGTLIGDPDSLPLPAENGFAVLPTLRNWTAGQAVVLGPLSDVLAIPEIQENHITKIVLLCTERGFAGVDVDYRGVLLDDRAAYSAFISALADALHAEGLRLTVVVERPTATDGEWDTGGFDWGSLGAAADALKVPFPEDPAVYVEGGEAQRLLEWAKGQVPRHKLNILVSSLSAERGNAGVSFISIEQALAPFGDAVALYGATQVEPGGQVEFGLSGTLLSITPLEAASTYRLEHKVGDGDSRTIWLGTASSLAVKLRWAQRYNLGGIAVSHAFNPGNAPGIVETVASYRSIVASPSEQGTNVVWAVTSPDALIEEKTAPLTDPGYAWTANVAAGAYSVNATISGFSHGSVAITVGEPEPEIVEPAEDENPTPASGGGGTVDACLKASYVADVTIPDNTQMDKGEEFVKTWRMKNTGTCEWPDETVLAKVNSQTGGPESVSVGTVEPGEEVDISVDMAAPDSDGVFDGTWALRVGDGDIPGGRVTVLIQAGEGGGIGATAVAPVSGGSFELGGHIRDWGFPYADNMHYSGMNWTKVQIHYGADASGIINASHSRGFKIQLSALGSSGMVTKSGFEEDFATWVASLAAAGADAIEVWNEPNIDREWQIGHISPQAYTKLLCASYNAIKAANPGTMVISAAPSPTGWFGGACTPNGCDDAPWMAGIRDAGAAQCMDYIGAHHNGGATSPSARIGHPANPSDPHHSWFFWPQTELYYNTFGGARKIFYTEMGYASQEGVPAFSSQFAWASSINNANQAAWLAEAVSLGANSGIVRCIIVWNIDFTRYGYDPQDGYAIIRPDGSCPACDSLHNVLGTR